MELRFIPGVISSLLPGEVRKLLAADCQPSAHDSGLSGLAELFLSVGTLASMYFHVIPAAINGYVGQATARPGGGAAMVEWAGGVPVAYGMGLSALAGFIFRWQTLLAVYFAFEGSVRVFAGFGADQTVPSMPLQVAQSLVLRAQRAIYEFRLPTLVADTLQQDGESLRVESCRPKSDWHRSVCISYQDTLYEVVDEGTGGKQRPWVYTLQPAPLHKVVRGLRYYEPDDVLKR